MFNPGLEIGQILKNADIVEKFKCGNMGGMRRSKTTNTLVIVSDYTKGIYHDKWIGGVLHYTGMGKSGDQDIRWSQNATLADSDFNGVDVHLFEMLESIFTAEELNLLINHILICSLVRMEMTERYGCFQLDQCRTTM